jgi:hypothetical protein
MRLVIDIEDNKVDAFLSFIKSLDFISVKSEDEFKLTDEQKNDIDLGLNDIEQGNVFSQEEVLLELKNKHSKYFK